MPITVGEIKKILAPLDGCTFGSQEELENAIYPLFGPLQSAMPGQSFRDLAEMLIDKGWAKREKIGGAYTLKFPAEKPTPPAPGGMTEPPPLKMRVPTLLELGPKFSYREIALLVHLHSNELMRSDMGFASLIAKGMVEHVNVADPLTTTEAAGIKQNIQAGKTQAVTAIFNEDFVGACQICDELRDAQRYLNSTDMVYRLTEIGKAFMQDQPDSILES